MEALEQNISRSQDYLIQPGETMSWSKLHETLMKT